jgi:tRNA threonylcarbamoyladenosine biosynthesis protein TsaB
MMAPEVCVLALESATDDVVVGLRAGGEMAYEESLPPREGERPRHATALLAEVERAVAAGGGWDRVGRIGVGVGPGSYTGLRIGIATGRALAQARGLEVVPVGTLGAVGLGIRERLEDADRALLPVLDARRGELFVQLHDSRGEPLTDPAVVAPDSLGDWLREAGGNHVASGGPRPLAAGSGAVRFARELEAARVETLPDGDPAHRLAARHVCELAASGGVRPLDRIQPVYLREPDARRWLDRDRPDRDQAAGL